MSVKALCEAVLDARFLNSPPFRGEKPFEIVQSESDRPRALVTEALWLDQTAASTYQVALTCSESVPNQFVYQYAHELAHFYLTPIEHPLFEVLAVAISLFVLEACASRWERSRTTAEQRYAAKFREYKDSVVNDARNRLRVSAFKLKDVMPRDSPAAQSTLVDDCHIVAGSIVCENILKQFEDWRPLLSLHRCVTDAKYCDFDLWSNGVEDAAFATALRSLVGPVFHVTESTPQLSRFRQCFRRIVCCQRD